MNYIFYITNNLITLTTFKTVRTKQAHFSFWTHRFMSSKIWKILDVLCGRSSTVVLDWLTTKLILKAYKVNVMFIIAQRIAVILVFDL